MNYRITRGSAYKGFPFSDKKDCNFPVPRNERKVAFQVGVSTNATVKIGRNQKRVASDSYEGIKYLRLRITWKKECTFNVYVGGVDGASRIVCRQVGIETMGNAPARPSSPQIPVNSAGCLKRWE
ncbi:hypothetical protein H4582DRAFT_2059252 [Lactarius indigo]|nr:hypothetical protein H4582DRAFT_2059252 [Lactarius indigo]